MRILIHGINFSPELTGIGKYTGEMAEWLAAQGHEVRVVTAPPYYPHWKITDGFANVWSKSEFIALDNCSGISTNYGKLVIYRCPLWVPAKPSGIKRILHLASFALSSLPVMLSQIFWRPQVVWVVQPALFCAPQAWLVARLCGAKAWLHIQDYEVDAAFDLGLLKGATARGLVAFAERWLMRRFDKVSTISQRMLDKAVAKGVALNQLVLFANWVNINAITPKCLAAENEISSANHFRRQLGIAQNTVVALYSGNMGNKQGLEILAQVASLLRTSPNIAFVFCGNGAGRPALVDLCAGLRNVQFLDLQPVELLGDLLGLADIHLLPQRADVADLVMPSKLTGMLASGRCVVATAHAGTELANVVQNCGLVVPPEQAQLFAKAIANLAGNAELRASLGAAGRAYAEAYLNIDAVLGKFEAELVSLVKG